MRVVLMGLLFSLVSTLSMGQSTVFITDRALGVNPFGNTPVFLSFAQVRVCSLPLTTTAPCAPVATITDIFGNSLSISGGNFGQLTTDFVGRFSFGCSTGSYQVQVAATGSNTPTVSYPVTCPSGTSAILSTANTWTLLQTFSGGIAVTGTIASPTISNPSTTGTDSGVETLVNKTLTAPAITNPATTGTDSGAETMVNKSLTSPTSSGTDSGTETLVNKTLTSPTITDPSTTGTDSGIETFFNKTLNTPKITGGINNNGSGYKHIRMTSCTTASGSNGTCQTTVNWTTAFADANYTDVCMLEGNTGTFLLGGSGGKTGASMAVISMNSPGQITAGSATLDCVAVHD